MKQIRNEQRKGLGEEDTHHWSRVCTKVRECTRRGKRMCKVLLVTVRRNSGRRSREGLHETATAKRREPRIAINWQWDAMKRLLRI